MKSKFKYLWNHIEIAVIILFFSLMCLVTFGSVITRYFFSFTFSWTEQFSRICFVIITFAGIRWAASKGAHLKVTVLTTVMPHKVEQVMILFGDIISIIYGVVMSFQILKMVRMQLQYNQVFSSIPGLSVSVMYMPGVIFMFLFASRIFEFSVVPILKEMFSKNKKAPTEYVEEGGEDK